MNEPRSAARPSQVKCHVIKCHVIEHMGACSGGRGSRAGRSRAHAPPPPVTAAAASAACAAQPYRSSRARATPLVHPKPDTTSYSPPPPGAPARRASNFSHWRPDWRQAAWAVRRYWPASWAASCGVCVWVGGGIISSGLAAGSPSQLLAAARGPPGVHPHPQQRSGRAPGRRLPRHTAGSPPAACR